MIQESSLLSVQQCHNSFRIIFDKIALSSLFLDHNSMFNVFVSFFPLNSMHFLSVCVAEVLNTLEGMQNFGRAGTPEEETNGSLRFWAKIGNGRLGFLKILPTCTSSWSFSLCWISFSLSFSETSPIMLWRVCFLLLHCPSLSLSTSVSESGCCFWRHLLVQLNIPFLMPRKISHLSCCEFTILSIANIPLVELL